LVNVALRPHAAEEAPGAKISKARRERDIPIDVDHTSRIRAVRGASGPPPARRIDDRRLQRVYAAGQKARCTDGDDAIDWRRGWHVESLRVRDRAHEHTAAADKR
jgi:hypothetical protein